MLDVSSATALRTLFTNGNNGALSNLNQLKGFLNNPAHTLSELSYNEAGNDNIFYSHASFWDSEFFVFTLEMQISSAITANEHYFGISNYEIDPLTKTISFNMWFDGYDEFGDWTAHAIKSYDTSTAIGLSNISHTVITYPDGWSEDSFTATFTGNSFYLKLIYDSSQITASFTPSSSSTALINSSPGPMTIESDDTLIKFDAGTGHTIATISLRGANIPLPSFTTTGWTAWTTIPNGGGEYRTRRQDNNQSLELELRNLDHNTFTTTAPLQILASTAWIKQISTSSTGILAVPAQTPAETNFRYQWFINSTPTTTGGTPIPKATKHIYVTPSLSSGTHYYYLEVTSAISPPLPKRQVLFIVNVT